VFSEKMSGGSTDQREQLTLALEFVREWDTLICTRLAADQRWNRQPMKKPLVIASTVCS
jgi:hypothetical protein